ncbi:nuclear transport factor 2 family protein [Saccharopolyspora sp. CA-218241]|uniref:nuclear transport factor 2 family protein n=1 Tax=Saccharopolyspora sp. CA-218241 TaxID=3240027 RepID=UPI003D962342
METGTTAHAGAEAVVSAFSRGWREPHPHAWDDVLAEDIRLVQPLLRDRVGKQALAEEYGRLLALVPDLRGEVTGWSATGSTVRVALRLTGTLGRLPLVLDVVDQLGLDDRGLIRSRRARFDPLPAVALLARQPRAWRAWWRSGVGPLLGRRRLLPHDPEHAGRTPVVAVGGLLLAASAWALSRHGRPARRGVSSRPSGRARRGIPGPAR